MALTLVTGGTGHLGRDFVDRLVRDGYRVRLFARARGDRPDVEWAKGDLATGAGLRDALPGVDTVINAATSSPIARRGGVRPVDFFRSPSAVDSRERSDCWRSARSSPSGTSCMCRSSGSMTRRCLTPGSSLPASGWFAAPRCPGPSFARCRSTTCSTGCSRASPGFPCGRCRRRHSIPPTPPMSPLTSWLAPSTGHAASAPRLAVPKTSRDACGRNRPVRLKAAANRQICTACGPH